MTTQDLASGKPSIGPGSQLGSYRLHELLGEGATGYVYRAMHAKLGREVALKLLRPELASRQETVSRFFREAKAVNRIRHRNIVEVTDFVELDDGLKFIVMELLRGRNIVDWARASRDVLRIVTVLAEVCDGLAAAHAVSVVHRDLKPQDVIVVPEPEGGELVKLLDFGAAKLLGGPQDGVQTIAGSLSGTPAYNAPEQAGGGAIDHRADIYSLGAIAYEALCGQPVFTGGMVELIYQHREIAPTPPRRTPGGAHLSEKLEQVILKCLAKRPDDRFARMSDVRDELLQLQRNGVLRASAPTIIAQVAAIAPRIGDDLDSAATLPREHEPVRNSAAAVFPARIPDRIPDIVPSAPPVAALPRASEPKVHGDPAPRLKGMLREWKPYLLPEGATSTYAGLSAEHSQQQDGPAPMRAWLLAGAAIAVVCGAIALWLGLRSNGAAPAKPAAHAVLDAAPPDAAPPDAAPHDAKLEEVVDAMQAAPAEDAAPEEQATPPEATAPRDDKPEKRDRPVKTLKSAKPDTSTSKTKSDKKTKTKASDNDDSDEPPPPKKKSTTKKPPPIKPDDTLDPFHH